MNRQPTLVLVSGLGADGRLFEPQRALPWPIVTVKWLEPHRRETLADYAQRLATALTVAEPFFLGLDAEISLTPVMNLDDLRAGLEKVMKARK